MKNVEILNELVNKQLDDVEWGKKLNYNELKRLSKYINTTIFDETKCCIWNGYITNIQNPNKGVYINFYFRGKKPVLHRLLYLNFIGKLGDDEYLKFTCENRGRCCNIKHLQKFRYVTNKEDKKKINKKKSDNKVQSKPDNPVSLTINFD